MDTIIESVKIKLARADSDLGSSYKPYDGIARIFCWVQFLFVSQ